MTDNSRIDIADDTAWAIFLGTCSLLFVATLLVAIIGVF